MKWGAQTAENKRNRTNGKHLLWLDQFDIRKAHWIVLSYHADRYWHLSNVVGMILLCIVVSHFRMIRMEKIDAIRGHFSLMNSICRNNDSKTKFQSLNVIFTIVSVLFFNDQRHIQERYQLIYGRNSSVWWVCKCIQRYEWQMEEMESNKINDEKQIQMA